jgi:phage terminase large subunit-like protein
VKKLEEVSAWLTALLQDGPTGASDVSRLAKEQGFRAATLRRASAEVGVRKEHVGGFGKDGWWRWSLSTFGGDSERLRDEALELLGGLVINEAGDRWGNVADDAQREDAAAVLDPGSGTPYHWLGRSRGYDKTAGLAGCCVAAMLTQAPAGAKLYVLAADKEQGRLFIDSVQGYAAHNPTLADALVIDQWKVSAPQVQATLEVLAADAPSSYGLRPWFLAIDELSVWSDTDAPRRLYDATTSALPKVEGSRCVVITSAGDPGHFSHKEREHALEDPLWHFHEVPGPAPWMDAGRLAEQRRRLLPSMYARLFENRWVAGEDRLTTIEDVRACVGHTGDLDYQSGYRYVVSLDIGLTNDRTVAVVAHAEQRAGGMVVVVDRLASWQGKPGHAVDLDDVEAWVEAACSDYHCRLVFDPYQAEHLAQQLKKRLVIVEPFTFSTANIGRLAVTTYRLLRDHLLDLPDDAALIDELVNVELREVSPGAYRIGHASGRHDDMAIATAMAAAHLVEKGAARPGYAVTMAARTIGVDFGVPEGL